MKLRGAALCARATTEGSLVSTQQRKVLYLPPKAHLAEFVDEKRGESGVKIHTCFPKIKSITITGYGIAASFDIYAGDP